MDKLILIPLAIGVAVAAWLIFRGFKRSNTESTGPSPRKAGGTGGDEPGP